MIDASESNLRKNNQFINGNSLDVPGYDTHDGRRVRNNLNDVLPVTTGIKGHDKMSAALMASCIASIASVLFGYTMGYTSPTQKDIEKELMSTTQFSWFAVSFVVKKIVKNKYSSFINKTPLNPFIIKKLVSLLLKELDNTEEKLRIYYDLPLFCFSLL